MRAAATWLAWLVLLLGLGVPLAQAQDVTCDRGDVAWVSAAVDANVGLGAGAGRCLANTIAGANYNDPSVPWGIQAALDCACSGLEIRILGNTGDYGSATASWNNRFDGNKTVNSTIAGGDGTILISGYADVNTSCTDSNSPTGCPVELNFTGGATNGWVMTGNDTELQGLLLHGATANCLTINTSGASNTGIGVAGLHIHTCGQNGILSTSGDRMEFARNYIHDVGSLATHAGIALPTGTGAAENTHLLYNYIRDVPIGILTGREGSFHWGNIIQDTSGDCIQINGTAIVFFQNTLRDCGGNGFALVASPGSGARTPHLQFNLITGAGGWGIADVGQGAQTAGLFAYNVLWGNSSGDIEPQPILLEYLNRTGVPVVYASATDSTPLSGADFTVTFPRGTTTTTINAGAVPEGGGAGGGGGGGGGGVFIPGGPR